MACHGETVPGSGAFASMTHGACVLSGTRSTRNAWRLATITKALNKPIFVIPAYTQRAQAPESSEIMYLDPGLHPQGVGRSCKAAVAATATLRRGDGLFRVTLRRPHEKAAKPSPWRSAQSRVS
jgi:hypothetical protein